MHQIPTPTVTLYCQICQSGCVTSCYQLCIDSSKESDTILKCTHDIFSFTLFHTFVILYYLSTSCGILMIWPASRKEWHPLKNIQVRLVLHILYHILSLKYCLSFFKPLSVIGPIFKHVLNIWCVCSIIHTKDHSVSVQEKLASGRL